MIKVFHILHACLCASLVITAPSTAFTEDISAGSRSEDLEGQVVLQKNTLSPPLLGASIHPGQGRIESTTMLNRLIEPGYWGNLKYEAVGKNSFRLQATGLEDSSGFFWLFETPQNMKNRWVEVLYSGAAVPGQVQLSFESGIPHTDANFIMPLENSFEPKSGFFKLPDRDPFSQITKIKFGFDPKFGRNIEMLILDLKILPEGSEPLGGNSESRSESF